MTVLNETRDDRKSAALAARRMKRDPGARIVDGYSFARDVLRCPTMRQAGVGAEQMTTAPEYASVFFLDGEMHKQRRIAIARYFTPKIIATRYRAVMEQTTDELLASLRAAGGGQLDMISFRLAVAVGAEIVGLTNSDQIAMAGRIRASLFGSRLPDMNPWVRPPAKLLSAFYALRFYVRDVRPAVEARRRARREDIISHLLDQGYPNREILIECLTYALAGMITTREFIVMAAWHLFGDDDLRARFLAGGEDDQLALLEEILRLEPVASQLYRRATVAGTFGDDTVGGGELLAVDIRAANTDSSVVGECPYALDPGRAKRQKIVGTYLTFGDGSHRCPGAQVALNESRVFLDRLFRVPGLRLVHEPTLQWCDALGSYEVRDALVACD